MLGRLLRNHYFTSSLGVLAVLAVIWFAGDWFGLDTRERRMFGVIVVMFLCLVSFMIAKALALRSAHLIEKLFRRDADDAVLNATPDKREEIKILRERLLKSIDTLKTSKLGRGKGGRAALYELPWYLILGHPAAGKSSALLNAGLNFPFSHKGNAGVQGVGGTRNCDWFFSTEAVLLDTAGRYVTHEEDRGEWVGFLQLLRKYRPRMPLNGVIVAVSVSELTQTTPEYRDNLAKRVRERIQELSDKLRLHIPVYIVLTKVDLVAGFAGFFAQMTDAERQQVWGATLAHKHGPGPSDSFAVKFQELQRGLHQLAAEKLIVVHDPRQKAALFSFPIEFSALEAPIKQFIARVFEDNPYQVKPLFRGMYFTSALQEGVPQSAGARRIGREFGLAPLAAGDQSGTTTRSYFLRSLFTDVIFRDRGLVLRSSGLRANLARTVGFAALMLGLAGVLGAWTWSYVGNSKLVAAVDEEITAAAQQRQSDKDLSARLAALDVLQGRLEQLYDYRKKGVPWNLGFGLYQGDKIERQVRQSYFLSLGELMLVPVAGELEARLAKLPTQGLRGSAAVAESSEGVAGRIERLGDDVSEGYNALKTYLMLDEENRKPEFASRIEAEHLRQQLPRYWRPWLEANRGKRSLEDLNQVAGRQIAFYVDQIREPDVPLLQPKPRIVTGSRATLNDVIRQSPVIERVYGRLKSDCNARFAPVTVPRLLNGKDADLVGGAVALPGCFTREGFDKFFKQAAEAASGREVGGSDWVLASATKDDLRTTGNPDKVKSDLRSLYFAEYAREWRKFLRGVAVQPAVGIEGDVRSLGRLGDPQSSPILAILKRALDETAWDVPIENKGRHIVNRAIESVQGDRAKLVDKIEMAQGPLERQFGDLASFVRGAPSGQTAGQAGGPGTSLDTYLQNLGRVKTRLTTVAGGNRGELAKAFLAQTMGGQGELHEAFAFADTTALARMDQETRDALRPMLLRPLTLAAAKLVEPATQEINQQWVSLVYTPWASNLAGRFPFADSTTEASPVEIGKFFKPGEGLVARFRDQQLGALLARAGDGYIARRWGDVGIAFKPEFLAALSRFAGGGAAQVLFNEGGEGMRFELRPEPTPELSEIILTIDGRQLRYRNEPQEWYGFAWPGAVADAGASLQTVGLRGGSETVANHPGKWGFMRLINRAQMRALDRSLYQVVWRTTQGFNVRFTLRVEGGGQLYLPSDLRGISLPQKIAE